MFIIQFRYYWFKLQLPNHCKGGARLYVDLMIFNTRFRCADILWSPHVIYYVPLPTRFNLRLFSVLFLYFSWFDIQNKLVWSYLPHRKIKFKLVVSSFFTIRCFASPCINRNRLTITNPAHSPGRATSGTSEREWGPAAAAIHSNKSRPHTHLNI